jgi:hypothetical protein
VAHYEDLVIFRKDDFPMDDILFLGGNLYLNFNTAIFHNEKLEMCYSNSIINILNSCYINTAINLNQRTSFFYLGNVEKVNSDKILQTNRYF